MPGWLLRLTGAGRLRVCTEPTAREAGRRSLCSPCSFRPGNRDDLVRLAEARARARTPGPSGTRVVVNNWINALSPEAARCWSARVHAGSLFLSHGDHVQRGATRCLMADGDNRAERGADEDLRPFYETSEEAMADHWGYVPRSYEDWRGGANDRISTPASGSWPWTTKCPRARSCAVFPMASVGSTLSWCADPGARRGLGFALLTHAFRELYARGCGEWRSASMPRTHQGDPAVRTSRDADRPAVRDLWQRTSGRNRADRCRRSVRQGDGERVAAGIGLCPTASQVSALSKVINMLKVIKVLNLVGAGADESLAATVLGSPSVTALAARASGRTNRTAAD